MRLGGSNSCFSNFINPMLFFMVLNIKCDQRSKMLISRYNCDKNENDTKAAAAAGFKNSDPGRCFISLLEPLVVNYCSGT